MFFLRCFRFIYSVVCGWYWKWLVVLRQWQLHERALQKNVRAHISIAMPLNEADNRNAYRLFAYNELESPKCFASKTSWDSSQSHITATAEWIKKEAIEKTKCNVMHVLFCSFPFWTLFIFILTLYHILHIIISIGGNKTPIILTNKYDFEYIPQKFNFLQLFRLSSNTSYMGYGDGGSHQILQNISIWKLIYLKINDVSFSFVYVMCLFDNHDKFLICFFLLALCFVRHLCQYMCTNAYQSNFNKFHHVVLFELKIQSKATMRHNLNVWFWYISNSICTYMKRICRNPKTKSKSFISESEAKWKSTNKHFNSWEMESLCSSVRFFRFFFPSASSLRFLFSLVFSSFFSNIFWLIIRVSPMCVC